jgi:hypothetical protein
MTVMTLHQQRTHPSYVEGCFGCKAASLQIGPAAMPVYSAGRPNYLTQRRHGSLSRDMEAYKRLRREGHQPPHISGSAFLERQADHPFEITRGKVYRGEAGRYFKEAIDMFDDNGFDPAMPHAEPKPVEQ